MPNLLQIIMYLIQKIKWQSQLIEKLSDYIDWLENDSNRPPKNTDITKFDYRTLEIDDAPKVVVLETLDYKQLLHEAEEAGTPIKKVRRRKDSTLVPKHIHCAKCQAPIHIFTHTMEQIISISVKSVRLCLVKRTGLKKIFF